MAMGIYEKEKKIRWISFRHMKCFFQIDIFSWYGGYGGYGYPGFYRPYYGGWGGYPYYGYGYGYGYGYPYYRPYGK